MPRKILNNEWTTEDEIRFITTTHPKGMTKLQFLLNYKEASTHRTNWDKIKTKKLFKALEVLIKNETKGV